MMSTWSRASKATPKSPLWATSPPSKVAVQDSPTAQPAKQPVSNPQFVIRLLGTCEHSLGFCASAVKLKQSMAPPTMTVNLFTVLPSTGLIVTSGQSVVTICKQRHLKHLRLIHHDWYLFVRD